jgi:hypothetical protein
MNIEETIDAFADGQNVDATALDAALASPEGRAYLIDLLALRALMQDETAAVVAAPARRAWSALSLARAAAIAFTLLGIGYAAGLRREEAAPIVATTDDTRPPEPTRVIELRPGVNWHESKGGD